MSLPVIRQGFHAATAAGISVSILTQPDTTAGSRVRRAPFSRSTIHRVKDILIPREP